MGRIIVNGSTVEVPFQVEPYRIGTLESRPRASPVSQIILHHDGCLSAERCYATLKHRGLSTHFCIDNNGAILQFLDPATDVAYHAGRFNSRSIGIDISNAVLLSLASKYSPPREVSTMSVHGKRVTGLLPYQCQIQAALDLLRVLRHLFPGVTNDHKPELRLYPEIDPTTPGIYGHAQVNRLKIDPFGFPFTMLKEV